MPLFAADSRGALDLATTDGRGIGRRELSLLLVSALLRGTGLEWYERGDLFDRVCTERPLPHDVPTEKIADLSEAQSPARTTQGRPPPSRHTRTTGNTALPDLENRPGVEFHGPPGGQISETVDRPDHPKRRGEPVRSVLQPGVPVAARHGTRWRTTGSRWRRPCDRLRTPRLIPTRSNRAYEKSIARARKCAHASGVGQQRRAAGRPGDLAGDLMAPTCRCGRSGSAMTIGLSLALCSSIGSGPSACSMSGDLSREVVSEMSGSWSGGPPPGSRYADVRPYAVADSLEDLHVNDTSWSDRWSGRPGPVAGLVRFWPVRPGQPGQAGPDVRDRSA